MIDRCRNPPEPEDQGLFFQHRDTQYSIVLLWRYRLLEALLPSTSRGEPPHTRMRIHVPIQSEDEDEDEVDGLVWFVDASSRSTQLHIHHAYVSYRIYVVSTTSHIT